MLKGDAPGLTDGDTIVAGRSLDEWSERLFPDVSMRVTDAYDEDSPYSRMVQVDHSYRHLVFKASMKAWSIRHTTFRLGMLCLSAMTVFMPHVQAFRSLRSDLKPRKPSPGMLSHHTSQALRH